jgi:hypothetical protein
MSRDSLPTIVYGLLILLIDDLFVVDRRSSFINGLVDLIIYRDIMCSVGA